MTMTHRDMIEWTKIKLKLTSGIGALCTIAMLADISHQALPIWLAIVISLVPFIIFLFIQPDEMPRSVVLPLQIFASLWYLALSVLLSVLFFKLPEKGKGWPVYFIGLAVGAIPCFVVFWRCLNPQASDTVTLGMRIPATLPGSDAVTSSVQIPVTLRPSRKKVAGLFIVSLLFVICGIWMVHDGQPMGYLCGGFFALGLTVFALQFHPRAAYLHLAPDGFTFCSLFRAYTVKWSHVQEFGVICIGPKWMVAWNFTPDYSAAGPGRAISKSLSGYEAALPDTYGMEPDELIVLMEGLRQRFGETRNETPDTRKL